ncbi:hypothetical protein [Mycoplasma ovis]|nr:hypothetical protein [Mycoplasma ovis]
MWKKLLLEIGAITGFGGGIGGWIGSSNNGLEVNSEDELYYFGESSPDLTKKPKFSNSLESDVGLVSLLNSTVFKSWRFKSEGVSEDLLFVKGWEWAGPHKVINSDSHSQSSRELFGGRRISSSMGWFGPRIASRIAQEIYGKKGRGSNKNLWDLLRDSGKYISKEELKGLSNFWGKRSIELEEDVLSLYQPRSWWIKVMGEDKEKKRVALELDLTGIKDMLNHTEDQLKKQKWSYGEWVNSSWIKTIRLLGNLEEVAFNYLKRMIWPEEAKNQKLKEKDIATVIKRLMSGEKIGFDCSSLQDKELSKYFEECKKKTEGIEVKAVLKSVWSNSGYYVPKQGQGAGWKTQTKASYPDWKKLNNMDDIEKTKVIEEECEQSSWAFWDTSIKIRQELCKRLVIPWFGDIVKDKRLCLVEVKDFNYLLQSQTYFKIFDFPTWHNKNAFWTKCSNYGI